MEFFYNLSTRTKLLSSFFIIIILNLIILVISINSMVYSRNVAITVNEVLLGSFGRISAAQIAASNTNNSFIKALGTSSNNYNTPELKRDINGLLSEIERTFDVIRVDYFNRSDYIEGCQKYKQLAQEVTAVIRNQVMPVVEQGDDIKSLEYFSLIAAPLFAEISETSMDLIKIQHEECAKLTVPAANPTPIYVNASLAALSTIIAIALAMFISSYIAKAIKEQIDIVETLAAGDFSLHIAQGHKDEFGRTHNALRKMRTALNDIITKTKKECQALQDEMRNLQSMSTSIASSSGNVENQALTVSAASDEMVSTTQDIARNCETAASSSNICKDISDNGLHQVIEAVNSIREQSEHTKDNAQKIESLAQQTKAIGSIVNTIDDIAAQTNLLALNAAIEAARAGEAGRGFAVVADEVRALASRTTASTQEISKMVKSIQDEASLATESINTSVENMEAVAEKASKTEELLKDITHHVIAVNQQITQIATAAEEQTSATSEISINMQHITTSTSDMTANANQQNSSMDNAYNDLGKLIQALAFFKTRE